MKKLMFPLILITAIFLQSAELCLSVDYGIPAGKWVYELKQGTGFDLGYKIKAGPGSITAGIDIKSFSSNVQQYRVNMLGIPVGYEYNVIKRDAFAAGLELYAGLAFIERSYSDTYERGISEYGGLRIYSQYSFSKISLRGFAGITRYSLTDGGNYLHCGIGAGFPDFRLFPE